MRGIVNASDACTLKVQLFCRLRLVITKTKFWFEVRDRQARAPSKGDRRPVKTLERREDAVRGKQGRHANC